MNHKTDEAGIAKAGIERRDLLKGLGLGALAGAVGAAAAATVPDAAAAAESRQDQVKQRYQETDHVKRFYALNRL